MNNKLLLDTAKKFGTPTYIYNAETIQNQYTKLKNVGPPKSKWNFDIQ